MPEQNPPKKNRNRGAVYPVEIMVRLTAEMGKELDDLIDFDPTLTKVGIIRTALRKHLAREKKKRSETQDDS